MKTSFAAAFALAAMTSVTNAEAKDCRASASARWNDVPGHTISAFTGGPDCARAVAVLTIRDGQGNPVFHESFVTEYVMILAGANTQASLATALKEWVDSSNPAFATTASLPEWPEGADAPASGEFPFYPAEEIDRAAWNRIRAAGAPVFCYVQGMESLGCVTKDGDAGIVKIGVQSFPG